MANVRLANANSERVYRVRRQELPVHCPREGDTLWSSHPRVYLPVGERDEARCPYCGAVYRLVDD